MERIFNNLENFLSCHVCSETFRDPASLSCNHNFCSSCLQQFWEQTNSRSCPICKRKSSKDNPLVNFGIKELADSFAGRQISGPSETEKGENQLIVVCSEHQEDPKSFCKDDQRAVCPVCEFSLHQSHKVVPIEQAVSELKEKLNSDLKPLQEKKERYKEVEQIYDDMLQHLKEQLFSTETQIRAEFNKLHQILKEEEESRLAALREEEEQKGQALTEEMKRIQEQISSLSDSISAVEEDLQKNNLSFLSSYKATQSRSRAQSSLSDPQLLSGALIDVAKHLGNLSFRVWEKMKEKIQFYPFFLDPNTANGRLHLSDDLTSVRHVESEHDLPKNPERISDFMHVFGSEGFSSGKHSWEVEVGDHPNWNIGLGRKSADSKEEKPWIPKFAKFCLWKCSGTYCNIAGKQIPIKKSMKKFRVQLDYDKGEVSFYDSENMSHIYTYRETFTEILFPYFSVGKRFDAETSDIKICPTDFPY
ncbi:nuclear factor 7, ovary-like [Cyprinodon tularosa]|uniref:nuclear factor 7, ovary-like n=1 Tax=Cyprinodon tularosa TaxID=77115 RepID=UPI0018E1DEA7|nr:nuclear factor 7, ovary-like [Cyprinodon tularosa]